MKIYHTETQADYDALMIKLEAEGCKWLSGRKPTETTKNWKINSSDTCVRVDKKMAMYDKKSYYTWEYPRVPITTYKAKADERMKFTKKNVGELFSKHDKYICYSLDDLYEDILNLDDTPEKVGVPKCFDEWYSEIKNRFIYKESGKKYALWKINQFGFGYWLQDVNGENIDKKAEVSKWVSSNTMIAIDAVLNGYTIEPEQLYYIPLPYLETSDGIQQVLSKRDTYFASRPNEKLKQRYTKEELEQVPEIYKPYAKPIEEEE